MKLGDLIDAAIEPFSPTAAARRRAARIGLDAIRQYDASARDRRTSGWKRPGTSADAENWRAYANLRNGARDLVRNNKYAAAGVRQMVANLVGDGIAPQFQHADKAVAQKAQDAWDRWAEGKVDGFGDFYEAEKLAVRGMVEGGESLVTWRPDKTGPDGRIDVLEGDYIDSSRFTEDASGARTTQGVAFDRDGDRVGFWLFDRHPGDVVLSTRMFSTLQPAEHIDHVFERLRPGQSRGVSWLAPVALTLRDIADIEDAVRLKKKVEACLALVITPGEGNSASPLSAEQAGQDDPKRPPIETLRPGMVFRTKPGETVTSVNPSSNGDGVEFIRQQLAAVSANMVPYFLLTGDTANATYSNLRAANLGHWAVLDDQQNNVIVPRICRPAVERRLRRSALELGDRRILQVRASWSFPVRRQVDPIKDLMAELIEIRSGLKLLSKGLAERGINSDQHMAEIAKMNGLIDSLGLALDSDPRRLTDKGVLQIATGYLAPSGEAQPSN